MNASIIATRTLSVISCMLLAACGGGSGGTTVPTPAPLTSIALPKTGQTTCYDISSATVACNTAGIPQGQDGAFQTGAAEPNPRFTVDDTGNCITDNLTGLLWIRNANLPAGTDAASTGTRTWQQALDFANNLDLCGFSDWRLPNRKELRSLINYNLANNAPALNTLGFNNAQAGLYWSSTSYANSADYAWTVDLGDGYVDAANKPDGAYVLSVRAGQ